VEKAKFDAVGGLDEAGFAVAFNDVDLCLKLQPPAGATSTNRACWCTVESKSRGKDFLPENRDRFARELKLLQQRWNTKRDTDPLHHPALDRTVETSYCLMTSHLPQEWIMLLATGDPQSQIWLFSARLCTIMRRSREPAPCV
jgi:hypothetical protein